MTPNPQIALLIFFGGAFIIFLITRFRIWQIRFRKNRRIEKTEVEDVLKQLYHVEYSGRKATLNAMAGALKMKDQQLVKLIEYMTVGNLIQLQENTIKLTDEGKEYALKIIRIHRLWEKYLSEKTGIDKTEWHAQAEKMEHQLTAEQTEALYQELGRPRFDPHGDPIPLKSGEIPETIGLPLSSFEAGSSVKITHIEDEPEIIYRQIIQKKLHIGQQLKLIENGDSQTRFVSEGHEYSLSAIVASNIGVKMLNEEEVYEEQKVRLSSLQEGETAKILGISRECRGANRRRLLDLGFIGGTTIETRLNGPMKEPRAFMIKNTLIALRNDQADLILIEKT